MRGMLRWSAGTGLGAILLLGLAYIGSSWAFGSGTFLLHRLRGEVLVLEPQSQSLGVAPVGSKRTAEVIIRNLSQSPITIPGARTDCSCVVTRDLPLTIAGRESKALEIEVEYRGDQRMFERTVAFYCDSPENKLLVCSLKGEFDQTNVNTSQ